MQKIIIICGPTAIGKTSLGIRLADKFNGEIVSADSSQVWKGFDIGTAKVSPKERLGIKHHLIDILEPSDHFDAANFIELADEAISNITSRNKCPFVVGGTGMYLKMLVHGVCDAPAKDTEFRSNAKKEIEAKGLSHLHDQLRLIDPEAALHISPNDTTRIVRALEIHYSTGLKASVLRKGHGFFKRRYDTLKIGLTLDRQIIYQRINDRVDKMIEEGLVDEVRALLGRYDETCQPFRAVGYKEIVASIRGSFDLETAILLTKQNTRHLAKRQMTWFRKDEEIKWFGPEEAQKIEREIREFLKN